MSIENVWLLEWSKSQQAVHIQPLRCAIDRAAARFMEGEGPPNDYEAIFAGTREECDAMSHKVHRVIDARAKRKEEE